MKGPRILSPVRLPISPPGQRENDWYRKKLQFVKDLQSDFLRGLCQSLTIS